MAAKIVDGEARDRLIIWMRRRMAEFGITVEALTASIQYDHDNRPVYRDAHGNSWNGQGEVPTWMKAARDAGLDPNFFRIGDASSSVDAREIDPRQLDFFRQDARPAKGSEMRHRN